MAPTSQSLSSSEAPGYSTFIAPALPRPSATNTRNVRVVCKTVLPQNATPEEVGERAAEVRAMQTLYIYEAPSTLPGLSFLRAPIDKLPGEMPSFWWKVKGSFLKAKLRLNFSNLTPAGIFDFIVTFIKSVMVNQKDSKAVEAAIQEYSTPMAVTTKIASDMRMNFRSALASESQFEERNPLLAPYRALFRVLPMPTIGTVFMEDRTFARLRIAGYNPLSLFAVPSADASPFPIPDDRMPFGDTVAAAAAQNRLYAVDFTVLSAVKPKPYRPEQALFPSSALFVIPREGGDLVPVAIDLPNGTVYPPKEGDAFNTHWSIAKLIINNCDAVHHELIAHLGRTHLLIEPFVAATMRQLPSSHPVYRLLKPHFEGTAFINDSAANNLVAPGGNIDKVFAGDITNMMEWTAGQVLNTKFNDIMPDVEMSARGVDHDVLFFPYRQDALEHFDALLEWVTTYVSTFYSSDDDVVNDAELQNWAAELVHPSAGKLKGFGDDDAGSLVTRKYLIRALAFVVFSASVQHASVNFPQRLLMSYAPCVAGGMWAELPDPEKEYVGIEKWQDMFAPLETAVNQVEVTNLLGGLYHTQLGNYRRGELPTDARIKNGLVSYNKRLAKIDERIKRRETKEDVKYEYLRPKNVPQSINI